MPMRIQQHAGLNAHSVKETTPASWMYCGAYFTRELLGKIKKVKSSSCACDPSISEDLPHFILHCTQHGSYPCLIKPSLIKSKSYKLYR